MIYFKSDRPGGGVVKGETLAWANYCALLAGWKSNTTEWYRPRFKFWPRHNFSLYL